MDGPCIVIIFKFKDTKNCILHVKCCVACISLLLLLCEYQYFILAHLSMLICILPSVAHTPQTGEEVTQQPSIRSKLNLCLSTQNHFCFIFFYNLICVKFLQIHFIFHVIKINPEWLNFNYKSNLLCFISSVQLFSFIKWP